MFSLVFEIGCSCCCTSMNSPRSSASDGCASPFDVVPLVFVSPVLFSLMPFLSFELFFACLFFFGFGFSTGTANALRTGSLRQSRKVS